MNRRPDDECQRERGTYGNADEGLQVRVIRTQGIVICWLLLTAVTVTPGAVVGAVMWSRWFASGSWMDQYSGYSASCRAGGFADLGWITTPGLHGGRLELECAGHPQSPYASALPAGGGCELSLTLSHLPGISSLKLNPPMALPSTGRAGVGSRVCTEMA